VGVAHAEFVALTIVGLVIANELQLQNELVIANSE